MNTLPSEFAGSNLEAGLRMDGQLGQGGMSRVWRAETAAGDFVAVKLPGQRVGDGVAESELIRREFDILSALSHRNVVSVLGLVEIQASPALVMEYVDGGDLVSLAGAHPRRWVPVALQVARALADLHDQGIVHRDVKARNILLRSGDEACLIDFALAAQLGGRALRSGGTPAYQSVAQRQGASPRLRDDVYAFAVLVYELWTGRLPYGVSPSLKSLEKPCDPPGIGRFSGFGDPQLLAMLLSETLDSGIPAAPGGMRPFIDALESAAGFD